VGFAARHHPRRQPAVGSAAAEDGEAGRLVLIVVSGGPDGGVIQDLDSNPCPAPCGARSQHRARGWRVAASPTARCVDLTVLAKVSRSWPARSGPAMPMFHVEGCALPVRYLRPYRRARRFDHAARHGAVVIPHELAAKLPAAIDLCAQGESHPRPLPIEGFGIAVLRQGLLASEDTTKAENALIAARIARYLMTRRQPP